MSKICEVCGKAPSAGRNVSHSHRVTNRWFRPNIQRVTIKDKEGHVRKANVCTKCMKAGKVVLSMGASRARAVSPTPG